MSRLNTYTLPVGPLDPVNPTEGGAPELRKVISDTAPGLTTSSTSNIYLYSIFIPANTFVANEVLDLRAFASCSSTRGGTITPFVTLRLYWGPNPNLTGATQIGVCAFNNDVLNGGGGVVKKGYQIHRRLGIRSTTTNTIVLDTTRNTATDIHFGTSYDGFIAGGVDYLSINWTTDFYFIVSGNTTSTADVLQVRYMKINN